MQPAQRLGPVDSDELVIVVELSIWSTAPSGYGAGELGEKAAANVLNWEPTGDSQQTGGLMSYGQLLAKGAREGTPPFWIIAIALVVIVGVAFLVSKTRDK
ncbi:hypothetical protein ACIPIU_00215 [Streptomyces massasporeus]|uniref:hypothetical protein n=1 Tax=Streptomyces massasporeus TaxID=67324 RepID=UPI0038111A0C